MDKTSLLFECRAQNEGAPAFAAKLQTLRLAAVCLYGPASFDDTTYVPVYARENGALFSPSGTDARQANEGQAYAWQAYTTLANEEERFTVVLDAPPTNLALALLANKRLPERIGRLVLAGGSLFGGDASPCAEANFFADPEAAEIVLNVGLNPLILPLEAVEQARGILDEAPLGGLFAALALLLADGEDGFVLTPAWARVETKGRITRGKFVTDLYSDKKLEKNARVVTGVEPDTLRRRFADAFLHG